MDLNLTVDLSTIIAAVALVFSIWSVWFTVWSQRRSSIQTQGLIELGKATVQARKIAAEVRSVTDVKRVKEAAEEKGKEAVVDALDQFTNLVSEMGFLYEGVAHYLPVETRSALDGKKEYIRRFVWENDDKKIESQDGMLAIFQFAEEVLNAIEEERDAIVERTR